MTRVRAWLQVYGGVLLVLVAVGAIIVAVVFSPPLPPREPGCAPPPTIAYGQPDTMLDSLEGRVSTTEQALGDYRERVAQLEVRVRELERRNP